MIAQKTKPKMIQHQEVPVAVPYLLSPSPSPSSSPDLSPTTKPLATFKSTTTTTTVKLEPRFSLPDSTPRSSKTELVIGGVRIYIYGLDDLKHRSDVDVGVLYLAHNRTRTYQVTEGIAHEVLHRYRNDGKTKSVELIAVTMNMRNHGDREVWLAVPGFFTHTTITDIAYRSAQQRISHGPTAMTITGWTCCP